MIPETRSDYAPWLSMSNPLNNKIGEIEIGDSVKVLSEFKTPENSKIKAPFLGLVEYKTEEKSLTLNWTSYFMIAKIHGRDTKDWIGKDIVYQGFGKCGQGHGQRWSAI